MADTGPPVGARFVGRLMVELPPDAWLPDGYALTPVAPKTPIPGYVPAPPFLVNDPSGRARMVYPDPNYVPPPAQQASLRAAIEDQLGPFQSEGFWTPRAREFLGMNRPDFLGAVDRAVYGVPDAIVTLFDLAGYGLQASIVGGTEVLRRAGVVDQTGAGELQRDANLGLLVVGTETGMGPRGAGLAADSGAMASRLLQRTQAIQPQLALVARVAGKAISLPLRVVAQSGYPQGRVFGILEELWADNRGSVPNFGGPPLTRDYRADRARGKAFDTSRADVYDLNQLYVVYAKNKSGKAVLDSLLLADRDGLRAGPVSRKNTQLADVTPATVIRYLREAYNKYRAGTVIANVASVQERYRGMTIKGQLFLEVPMQNKPIPQAILDAARSLNIVIRDVSGREY